MFKIKFKKVMKNKALKNPFKANVLNTYKGIAMATEFTFDSIVQVNIKR